MSLASTASRKTFSGISPRAWEHPGHRAALAALRRMRGFDSVLRRIVGAIGERRLRMFFLGNAVRVSSQQLPHLDELLREACTTLDLKRVPELYIQQDPHVNAMAVGVDDPFIVLNSSLVEESNIEDLRCIVGHEIGHVLSGHALYRTMLLVLLRATDSVFPLTAVALPIVMALQEWSRKSELSADRAGLLVVQDIDVAQRVLLRLAGGSMDGLDADAFAAQADEYEQGGNISDNLAKLVNLMFASHPFPALRIAELRKWTRGKQYEEILAGNYPERGSAEEAQTEAELGGLAENYRIGWQKAQDSVSDALSGALRAGQNAYAMLFEETDEKQPREDLQSPAPAADARTEG